MAALDKASSVPVTTPVPPVRQYSFTDWQVNNPTAPPPGDRMDAEYDRANASIAQVINWVEANVGLTTPPSDPGNFDSDAAGSAALAQDYADVTMAWAEHMPDTIPPNILAVMGVTGDHWSSRWWANQAVNIARNSGAFSGEAPPANPYPGQFWFDSANPQLYVWYVDPTSAQWVIATAYAGGLTTDAPSDGQTYGRQNGAWQNFAAGGPYLPLTGGTVTGPLNYTATGGTVARSAQARAADVANVLDYGADPTGVADSSTAFNAAAAHISPATGRRVSVYVPSGKYRINQQVTLTDGQSLMGDGAGATMLYISEQLNPTATSVIKLTTSVTDPGPVISDLMMWFEQPIDATSRATFKTLAAGGTSHNGGTGVQYPWAIAADTSTVRYTIRNVSIAGSWNGIEANKAVFWIDGLKICSFNIGISIGGTAAVPVGDWAHLSDIEFWVFGLNTAALQNIYMDGQTIAMQIGAQNGLTCQNISCFASRLVFTTDAVGGWFSFTNLAMDTDQATIEVTTCAWLQITNLYTTAGPNAVRAFVGISGGRVIITNWYGHSGSPHEMLYVNGGDVTVVGATLMPSNSNFDVVAVLGTGVLRLSSSKIYASGIATWVRPVINQYDSARLQVNDIDVIGDATSGLVVAFTTDQTGNRCGNIAMPTGWRRLYAPVGSGLGRYGDVFLAPTDSTSMQVGSFGFLRLGATTHSSTAFGDRAMDQHGDTGSNNTAMGFLAGYNVGSGTYNSFFGSVSGFASSAPMTGNANSCFGAVSGQNLSSGTDNTFIGANAGASVTTGSGNIVIGSGQGTPAAGSSNTINIGGVFTGSGINTPATSIATIPGTLIVGGPITVATSGPTIRAGTGAATGTQPKGSMWMRTDGAVGSTLYVTQGGGTWAAVAGV